ncbi:MAG TPA: methyltransferase domain-containing protein [Baekduia sp.]|uniref:class I SAM-dependent methyltransferase n=1 Tax=Baekduia sp. TaxID=2600305 RepID=UPI002D783FCF|nr:methyltransferase domain-containing protein [Baekduia sp.]HET6506245.1 methyltransferase domain-containing protein [Baekduia sp.]
MADPLQLLRTTLGEQLAGLRGVGVEELPPALLDVAVERFAVGGERAASRDVSLVLPRDWEQLRHEEGGAGRPIPYWARPWPSGLELAGALADDPTMVSAGARVLELGCGLGAPSVVAARAGAEVLATDGAPDAVAFAAHNLALNGVTAEVAHVDWAAHGEALVARGPFDVLLAADVLYLQANVEIALRLWPRLLKDDGVLLLADPRRAGTRDFLAAARGTFDLVSERRGDDVALHTLRPCRPPAR